MCSSVTRLELYFFVCFETGAHSIAKTELELTPVLRLPSLEC